MKSVIREFLSWSKTEQRGVLALLFIILSIHTVKLLYPRFQSGDYKLSQEELAAFEELFSRQSKARANSSKSFQQNKKKEKIVELFPFNPNEINQEDWEKLGFSQKQAAGIMNFRNRGAVFNVKSDLMKLYYVDSARYAELEPYILLPDKQIVNAVSVPKSKVKIKLAEVVELNSADSLTLLTLPGIGPFRVMKILNYRNRLGGFYSLSQLTEIRNFPDSLLEKLNSRIHIDTSLINRIPLNSASYEELNAHPYFWYGVAKSIVNYRAKHGPFQSAGELYNIYSLKPEQIERLVHYITFE